MVDCLALHNGQPLTPPAIPLDDPIVTRGDGCFEAARCYSGAMFGLDEHLERLAASARAMSIVLPERRQLRLWMSQVAEARGDGVVRLFASAGGDVYVFSVGLAPIPESLRLLPVVAPWHPGGAEWDLAGVKTLSYAPNVAATRGAQASGFDEALLVSRDGHVLEGPTSGVLWVRDGVVETASLDLGVLRSVTAEFALTHAAIEGFDVRRGRHRLDRLEGASEVALMSTTREVLPVVAVGEITYLAGPVTALLAAAYRASVEALHA